MRYALVSDIHANLQAWQAVLEDIQAFQIDEIINLGDVVGYGPNPAEVLASVRKHSRISVIGNHDAVCAGRMCASIFNDQARAAIEWTQGQLDDEASQFLKTLPETAHPADGSFLITHAEVVAPLDFGYILTAEDAQENFAACEDSVIFIGHTHRPGVFLRNESGEVSLHEPGAFNCDPSLRFIINPGSVGDPRSEDIVASYCIFDSETRDVEFRRVAFDIEAYRRAIDASGLETRPFFLRFLDETGGSQIPSVVETDAAPQFDVSVSMPVAKKRNPLLPVGIIALLIGVAALAWIIVPKSRHDGKAGETAAAAETKKPPASTAAAKARKKSAPAPPPKIATKFPVTARYLRISNPKGEYLSLAEVQVISSGKNVAMGKKASQSSTFAENMRASIAVDGITQGTRDGQFTHTGKERPIWWEVDLGKAYRIEKVVLHNRNQGANPRDLMQRLDGFTLEAFGAKHQPVYRTTDNPGKKLSNEVR